MRCACLQKNQVLAFQLPTDTAPMKRKTLSLRKGRREVLRGKTASLDAVNTPTGLFTKDGTERIAPSSRSRLKRWPQTASRTRAGWPSSWRRSTGTRAGGTPKPMSTSNDRRAFTTSPTEDAIEKIASEHPSIAGTIDSQIASRLVKLLEESTEEAEGERDATHDSIARRVSQLQTVLLEKEIEHAHGEDAALIARRLHHVAYQQDLFEAVRHLDHRRFLLPLLFGIGQA